MTRNTIIIVTATILFLFCSVCYAADQQDTHRASAQMRTGLPVVLINIAAPEEMKQEALGLTLLLQNSVATPTRKLIDRDGLDDVMLPSTGNQKKDVLLVKDILYFASVSGANKVIQGWLERYPDRLQLDLRDYDVFTGKSTDAVRLTAETQDVDGLMSQALAPINRWLGEPEKAQQTESAAFSLDETNTLAQLWLAKSPWEMEQTLELLELLCSLPQKTPRLSPWLLRKLVAKMGTVDDPLSKALLAELAQNTEDAIRIYNSIPAKSKAAHLAALRSAILEYRYGHQAKAERAFKKIARKYKKHPLAKLWSAHLLIEAGKDRRAAKALASIKKAKIHPELYRRLATNFERQDKALQAAKATHLAVETASLRGLVSLAAKLSVLEARLKQTDVEATRIFPAYLDEAERAELLKYFSKQTESKSKNLALARLISIGKTPQTAQRYYEALVMSGDYRADDFTEAGRFLSRFGNDPKMAGLVLKVALKLDPASESVLFALADHYLKQGDLDAAMALCKQVKKHFPLWPYVSRLDARYKRICKETLKAEKSLRARLEAYPDDAEALVLLIRVLMDLDRMLEAQLQYAHLEAVDIRLANALGPPSKSETTAKLGEIKTEGNESFLAEAANRKGEGKYSELEKLQQGLNESLKDDKLKLDLSDLAGLMDSSKPDELKRIASDLGIRVNTDKAASQLQQLQLENKNAAPMLPPGKGTGLLDTLKGMADMAKKYREEQAAKAQAAMAEEEKKSLSAWYFNWSEGLALKLAILLAVLLLVLTVAVTILYWYRKATGTGGLTARVSYNRAFHEGFFIGRLSENELETAFENVTKFWRSANRSQPGPVRIFWKTLFPYTTMAVRDILTFEHIPPGAYHLYIASIQTDPKTELPIGSVEIHERVTISTGMGNAELRFEEALAYVGVKVVRKIHIDTSQADALTGKKKDPVVVTADSLPDLNESGKLNEEISVYLPTGRHLLNIQFGATVMQREVTVKEDLSPQWLELDLQSVNVRKARLDSSPV